ncbi:hypothetical protein BGZ54_005147 [Gamsiella multidivaricata]|nr:hypothetical protein BGZ54_005147 [Gamsiella multidivaricata]
MTDSAVHQQSKRLAGLSITNSSGNKVSILNDSPHDLNKATIHNESREREYESRPPIAHPEHGLPPLRSPRSPHFRDRHNGRDYFTDDRRDPYYSPSSHRQRSESHEAGRSTSLTNAATPFRSGFDSRAAEAANSQRSRSLSSGAQLYPYNPNGPGMSPSSPFIPTGASPLPFFMRAFSEDTASDEHEAAYRGLIGHPGLPEGLLTGPSFSKRKYSCTHPGCNKRFTTSGHLARHNRIHTGERNFSCLMPGCPSKFSRQDNMMQHYRTHISPKSRRGTSKKQDNQDADNANDVADDSEAGEHQPSASQEHSPAAPAAASIPPPPSSSSTAGPSSRHDSRQSSIPRFYPADQHADEAMDHDEQMESRPDNSNTLNLHREPLPAAAAVAATGQSLHRQRRR